MKELTIVVRNQPEFMDAMDAQIALFEVEYPGVSVRRLSPGIEECYDRYITRGGCGRGETDLFLTVTDWIPEAVETDQFRNLSDAEAEGWTQNWHPALTEVVRYQDGLYATPYHCGPQVLHIRRDLFDDESQKKAFREATGRELTVPRNWKEFSEVASFFRQPENGLYGCCVGAFPDGHNDVYDFLTLLWANGGGVTKRGVDFESEPSKKALDFYASLFTDGIVHPDCLELNSFQSGVHYVQGNVAMMWNWFGFASFADDRATSRIVGKNEVHPMPVGDSPCALNVFWAMAVASGSREPVLAMEFLQYLMKPEVDRITCNNGCIGTHLENWRSPEILNQFPQYKVLEESYSNSRPLPSVPYWHTIQTEITQQVSRRLRGSNAIP